MPATLPSAIEAALSTNDVARILTETLLHFGCQAGTVHVLREGELWLAAHSGIPEPIVQIVQRVPIGKGIAGLAAERREPVQLCNLQTDESGQARPGAKMTGMEGSLAVPMLVKGDLRGVLGIAKAEAHDWTTEETDLALLIGSRLAECCA
jgi:signal transduction protein with GAF and PtsI domain